MSGPWEQYQKASPDTAPWQQYSKAPSDRQVDPLTRTDKFMRGIKDPIDGGAQLLTRLLHKGVVDAGNKANNWIADKTGLVARIPEGGVDQMVRSDLRQYEKRRQAQGETGIDGWRMTGNILNPVNLAAPVRAAGLGGKVALGVSTGAVSGALAPTSTDAGYWDEKRGQVLAGAAGGALVPAIGAAASRLVSPKASTNPQLQRLMKEGVRPTIGQALGGAWNAAEEKLMSAPILGDMIGRARRSANSDFERAAMTRALQPIGAKLPKGVSGREAIEHVEQELGKRYDKVLTNIGAIRPDQQFTTKVNSLTQMVQSSRLPDTEKAKFYLALDKVQSSMDRNGVITSNSFKTLESALGSDFRKLSSSQNIYDGEIAPAVKQVQQELREMLQRQAGSHADELAKSNKGWANFKRVQRASSALGAENGSFSPAQFQNAVKAMDRSKDKGAFARGKALGQDLGDAGRSVLTGKVPDSGTAGRLLLNVGAGSGLAALSPGAAAGLIGGAALYTSPIQRVLVAATASRPASAQHAAELLRDASPYLIPAGAQVGTGLLAYPSP